MTDTVVSVLDRPEWINPLYGTITSLFGNRINPVTMSPEFHNGLDIAVPEGTPVLSVRYATVYHVGYSPLNGKYMRLRCDSGYHIVYAHLSAFLANLNDRVAQGDIVALSGNTGQSTGPHLHYGLSREGQRLDPITRVYGLSKTQSAAAEYARRQ